MVAVSTPHFVIFPFMAKGHTIPLLYLARLLCQRNITVTIITTPANSPAIHSVLTGDHNIANIIEIPFPKFIHGIPDGVESTDKLPSMSLFPLFASATKLMQPIFEQELEELQHVSCIISDTFLGWTQECADKFGIPRIGFFGMSCFAMTMYEILVRGKPHARTTSLDQPFFISPNHFPKLKLTRNDFDPPFNQLQPKGESIDFLMEQIFALSRSFGLIVNSFHELESSYADFWNRCFGPKAWCIGPFSSQAAVKEKEFEVGAPIWIRWLDRKLKEGEHVLYVAFGTQAEISGEQFLEIAKGLENSMVSFLWVHSRLKGIMDDDQLLLLDGFEERVRDRGMVVRNWVDQMEILKHESVKGFLSHCGWNSVTESICAGVPILAMPFIAEQHLNARLVVEELCIGLRIKPSNGTVRGFVEAEEVERKVREMMMMERKRCEMMRKKVKKLAQAACAAMGEGGSSRVNLDKLIQDVCNYQANKAHV